MIMPQYKHYYR